MDRIILTEKLESLRRCIQRTEDKTPANIVQFMQGIDLHDIIAINLARTVQLSIDIGNQIISHSELTAPQTIGDICCPS